MSESGFETYLIMKHGKRWEIKNKIEKVERKLKYMLSGDNNARFSKYLTSLSSPSDILNCERGGVKELSSLEEEVLKEKVSAEASYGERFSDNGQVYDWNKEKKESLEIWKIYLAIKLRTLNSQHPQNHRLRAVSLFPWSVAQNTRDTQMTTRVTEGAKRERHDLVSRVSRPRRSTFARACTLLTKSEESESRHTSCLMGGKSPSDKLMSRKENEGLARNQPQKHGQNHAKIQHIGSIKDLRPQNT